MGYGAKSNGSANLRTRDFFCVSVYVDRSRKGGTEEKRDQIRASGEEDRNLKKGVTLSGGAGTASGIDREGWGVVVGKKPLLYCFWVRGGWVDGYS